MQQEKTDIVKSVMLIKSILMDMNNMKAHLNDDKPTFYNVSFLGMRNFLSKNDFSIFENVINKIYGIYLIFRNTLMCFRVF